MKSLIMFTLILLCSQLFSQNVNQFDTNGENVYVERISGDSNINSLLVHPIETSQNNKAYLETLINKADQNNESLLVEYFSQHWDGNDWVNEWRVLNTYDENDILIEEQTADWDGSVWSPRSRLTYSFDDDGKIIRRVLLKWDGNAWIDNYQFLQSYDDIGNLIEILGSNWDGSAWLEKYRTSFSYNDTKNVTEMIGEELDGANWIKDERENYIYNENSFLTESSTQIWFNSNWLNRKKNMKMYDESNIIIKESYHNWNGSDWTEGIQNLYSYDERNNKIESIRQGWHNGEWLNDQRHTSVYDDNNKLIEEFYTYWKDSVWSTASSKNKYTYDENDNLIEKLDLDYSPNTNTWSNGWRDVYIYTSVTGVESDENIVTSYKLSNNYPNPFNPTTLIGYTIPSSVKSQKSKVKSENENHSIPSNLPASGVGVEGANVQLKVYDILGREVATLVNSKQNPGYHEIEFDASHFTNGVYFYRLFVYTNEGVADFVKTKKMILLK